MLFLLSIAQIMNCTGWICFAPISSKIIFAYKSESVSTFEINYLSFIFMIMFLPMNFISIWVIEKKGLRTAILAGVGI